MIQRKGTADGFQTLAQLSRRQPRTLPCGAPFQYGTTLYSLLKLLGPYLTVVCWYYSSTSDGLVLIHSVRREVQVSSFFCYCNVYYNEALHANSKQKNKKQLLILLQATTITITVLQYSLSCCWCLRVSRLLQCKALFRQHVDTAATNKQQKIKVLKFLTNPIHLAKSRWSAVTDPCQ